MQSTVFSNPSDRSIAKKAVLQQQVSVMKKIRNDFAQLRR